MLGWFKKKKSPEEKGLAEWGGAGADAPGAKTPQGAASPGAQPTTVSGDTKAEGAWLALFANFEDPIRFAPVAALAESFTQGEDRARFAAKKIGTRDDNLVQVMLDHKAYGSGRADITVAAQEASRRLEGVLGGTLNPGEYAGVAYPDSEGGMHQILTTPLDPGSEEVSRAMIDPGADGEPVMTIATPEPRNPDA